MPIQHSLWRVGPQPRRIANDALPSEALLEDMIVAEPAILSSEWMIIGRQEDTGYGGRIDLLALAPDGALILIELKRDKTPREVVAQALDYASWAETLEPQDLERIYARLRPRHSLDDDFHVRFGTPLETETLNQSHQIVIVAATLDAASERIVNYLNARDIPINVLFFQVFNTESGQLLSRVWLLDPVETQATASISAQASGKEPWNGEYYASFGHGDTRDWEEARRFGFISAGGGAWYSGTLNLLKPDDLVWVKVPQQGFVGVGRVRSSAVAAGDLVLRDAEGAEHPALELLNKGNYHRDFVDDQQRQEYFVAIDWSETRPLSNAVNEAGMFGNQNTVCAPKTPKWRHTVDRLKTAFPNWNRVT